jgi:hypothetical protein
VGEVWIADVDVTRLGLLIDCVDRIELKQLANPTVVSVEGLEVDMASTIVQVLEGKTAHP